MGRIRISVDDPGGLEDNRAVFGQPLSASVSGSPGEVDFKFWRSAKYGLIRRRTIAGSQSYPEIWRDGTWVTGSAYVMDAITGMGEDMWSCGEMALPQDEASAEAYAAEHGVDIYAAGEQDPRTS